MKLILYFILFVSVVYAYHDGRFSLHGSESEVKDMQTVEWDHFMLVMEWPQSSCEYVNATHQHHQCVINPLVKGWTLHGLWPSASTKQDPFYCTKDKFDFSKVQDLQNNLNTYWPNIFIETSSASFWKHEYEKHGTCAGSVPRFSGEHNFFQQTLELRSKYDPMPVLEQKGISPREDGYRFDQILDALGSVYSKRFCVECSDLAAQSRQVFAGVYVCLSKDDQQFIDCVKCEHMCRQDELVFYHPLHN